MTFEIELGGRIRSISVRRANRDDHYVVVVDGRSLEIAARRSGDLGLVIATVATQQADDVTADKTNGRNGFRMGGETHRVFVTAAGGAGEVLVTLDGRMAVARLDGRRRPSTDTVAHSDGDQSVTAPMPGRVVRVLVAAGDEVAAGQGVVVVEAMKMENELRSPKTGKVKDVNVSAGTSVDAGKVLVVIE
jgi:biotin carboxyl carrier protein